MEPASTTQLRHILERMNVGTALLDRTTLHVLYANSYMISFCPEPWQNQELMDRPASDILPSDIYQLAEPLFRQVCDVGQTISLSDIPYEGFLETRGRTYWRVSLELTPLVPTTPTEDQALLVMLEDVTNMVRSRLQMEAIHHISAAIASQSPLHDVLDRILQAMQELVGSRRCAVLMIDTEEEQKERASSETPDVRAHPEPETRTVTIVAQQGLYESAAHWHPRVDKLLLLGQIIQVRQALVIPDTSTMPEINFPILDDNGKPRRPGAVVSVPILETLPEGLPGPVLGTIEIYHRRARGLPKEEVALLEQFVPQAGLAIQNARLFQRTNLLARVASQQAHQLENVMRAIPDGVIIYDTQGRLLEINHAASLLLDWTNQDIGQPLSQISARSRRNPSQLPQNSAHIGDLLTDLEQHPEEQAVDEFELIGTDSQTHTVRRSKAPIKDTNDMTFAYVVVYHDVTKQAVARRQTEEEVKTRTAQLAQRNADLQSTQAALRLYNDRLQLLLERLPAGVMVISLEGQQVALMNNQAIQLLERMGVPFPPVETGSIAQPQTLSEAVGIKIEQLLKGITLYNPAGTVVPYEEQPLYQALHKGEASEAELYLSQVDGQILHLLVNAAPLLAGDGTAANVVLVWQDITRIKALERSREDFFTTMAHEIKTPLANIRAHLSALQANDMVWSSEQQLDFLGTADEQVERLVGMINHFLDASRVEAGALRPELEPILLPEMFEDLRDRLEALISSSQRLLTIRMPETLPAVLADYELIMSVLINLLSNAFRYAPRGDTVYLEAEVTNGHATAQSITLRVIDYGPGITPEHQTELFTRFSTFAAARRPTADRPGQIAESRTAKQRGSRRWSPASGLGLYISKGIIEAHGSTLEVQSHPGTGTTFTFTLALASSAKLEVR